MDPIDKQNRALELNERLNVLIKVSVMPKFVDGALRS